ncbi:hypothetical protein E2C01_002336 [Portunus trituberculatus]|uniref:Uncharacterized protein n=1 Tax=Portunus trituberculatus TaxID=210409 RepID=A0A5B7CJG1_PORTR|nr:hypothetical protein [Portunus trituberculatus]
MTHYNRTRDIYRDKQQADAVGKKRGLSWRDLGTGRQASDRGQRKGRRGVREEVGGGGKQCLAESEAVPLLARCNTSPKKERMYLWLRGDQLSTKRRKVRGILLIQMRDTSRGEEEEEEEEEEEKRGVANTDGQ